MEQRLFEKSVLISRCEAALESVRVHAPLIHNITNFVVMHTTANALLAAGASPLMAHAIEEMDDISKITDALVLNIGTLDTLWILSMRRAGQFAAERGLPIVFDPVGAGASSLRTETARSLIEELHPGTVRGNASEIMALVNSAIASKGVDSLQDSSDSLGSAKELAEVFGCVVSVSGAKDLITDGFNHVTVYGGSPLMTRVTGMGCTATALTAACTAGAQKEHIESYTLVGAVTAMALMAEAGDIAQAECSGPGTFLIRFLDALYRCSPQDLGKHIESVLPVE